MLAGSAARSPEEVVQRLLAVQAQDSRGARLSVRCRSTGLVAGDVDDALTAARSLVVTWLNRGTLHLVTAADYWWLHSLTTPRLAAQSERRLRQEGVSPAAAELGIAVVADAVLNDGPQTRQQLRSRLDDAGVPTAGQALVYILFAASLRRLVVRGPMIGTDAAFVSPTGWLGQAPAELDHDEALGRLARRYLAGHGPATVQDLAKWAGVTLGDARRGVEVIGDEVSVENDQVMLASTRHGAVVPASPRLLGPFDPLLHGWVSREPFVGAHRGVVTTNGIFRPVALVEGHVVATWGLPKGRVEITPLEPIAADVRDALVRDGVDVLRFLELPNRPPMFT